MALPPVDPNYLNTLMLVVIALFTALTTWLQQRNAEHAAKRADEVKSTLEQSGIESQRAADEAKTALAANDARVAQKLEAIASVADNTHTLVNNQFPIQLQLVATSARALANITHLQGDIDAAELAEERVRKHAFGQSIVDRKPAPKASDSNPDTNTNTEGDPNAKPD